jgi:hypothetical protein
MVTPFTPAIPTASQSLPRAILEISSSVATGALAGYTFSIINPVGGAIFGLAASATRIVGNYPVDRLGFHSSIKKALHLFSFILGSAAGVYAASLAGYTLTVGGTVGMTVAMAIPLYLAVPTAVLFSTICLTCYGAWVTDQPLS